MSLLEEQVADNKPYMRKREETVLKIIEAIRKVEATQEWSTLKTEVFDSLVVTLEKELRDEAKKENPDAFKLNRLAGQLKWAEKYSELPKLENFFKVELIGLRKQLYGTELNGD